MKKIDRYILTSLGRLLIILAENNGKASLAYARKEIGTTVYTAILNGSKLDLIDYNEGEKTITLKKEGKVIAECLVSCLREI